MTTPNRHLHDRLHALALNLWWAWHPEVIDLFRDLDPLLWRQIDHNPIAFLNRITPDQIEERASELVLHSRINYAFRRMNEYVQASKTWGSLHCGNLHKRLVVYFSAEFGLHESLPIYSGGLGILAGDHLKSASDMGIPLMGIGLLYQQGYFCQRLNGDGWQEEDYVNLDIKNLPLAKSDGFERTISYCTNGHPGRLSPGSGLENTSGTGSSVFARFQHRRELKRRSPTDLSTIRWRQ